MPRPFDGSQPPVAGETYSVPTIYGTWGDAGKADWPIFGPVHNDRGIIGFPYLHAHVDPRFVTDEQFVAAEPLAALAASLPGAPPFLEELAGGWGRQAFVIPCNPEPEVIYRPLQCVRATLSPPAFFEKRHWFPKLCDAMRHARLGDDMVCPHQGVSLASIPPEGDTVRCPLHGLVWNLKTRCVVPPRELPPEGYCPLDGE